MKRLLLLLVSPIYFFTITSCHDSGTESTNTDSASVASSSQLDTTKPAVKIVDYKDWEITKDTADKMMLHYYLHPLGNNKSNIRDSNLVVLDQIIAAYGSKNVKWKIARYRAIDTVRYSTLRNFKIGSDTGRVTNYRTWIVKVTIKAKSSGFTDQVFYYDIATICPPPYDNNGDCAIPLRKDSTVLDSAKKIKSATSTK